MSDIRNIPSRLPTEEGFYWWRRGPGCEWRMVQIIKFSEEWRYWSTYDVEFNQWHGRSLAIWATFDEHAQGEWLKIKKPPTCQKEPQ